MASTDVTTSEQTFAGGLQRLLTLDDVDMRGGVPRRILATARALAKDIGSDPSTAQQMLIQRAAMLAALLTHAEASLLLGRPDIPLSDYIALAMAMTRTFRYGDDDDDAFALSPSRPPRSLMQQRLGGRLDACLLLVG
jgi:hypothetical protein